MRLAAGMALVLVLVGITFFVLRSPTPQPPTVGPEQAARQTTGDSALEEALLSLDREIELRSDDADLHFRRSNVLRELGHTEAADAAYERYNIELRPYGDFPSAGPPGSLGYR
jgi:hypothetical protein